MKTESLLFSFSLPSIILCLVSLVCVGDSAHPWLLLLTLRWGDHTLTSPPLPFFLILWNCVDSWVKCSFFFFFVSISSFYGLFDLIVLVIGVLVISCNPITLIDFLKKCANFRFSLLLIKSCLIVIFIILGFDGFWIYEFDIWSKFC